MAEIHSHGGWVATIDPEHLKKEFTRAMILSGHTILNVVDAHHAGGAYSSVWILSEGYLAIQTLPEGKRTKFDLCSRNKQFCDSFVNNMPFDLLEI